MSKTCTACGAVNDSNRIVCKNCLKEIERVPGRSYLDRLENAGMDPSRPPVGLDELMLAPAQDIGWTDGEFTVTVRNDTPSLAAYAITARGGDGLQCELDTSRVTLAAGTATSIPLKVRSRRRLVGDARRLVFTVEARADGADHGRVLQGAFVQQPLFRSARPLVAAVALLICASGVVVTKALQPVEARVSSSNITGESGRGDRVEITARGEETLSAAPEIRTSGKSYLIHAKRHRHPAAHH